MFVIDYLRILKVSGCPVADLGAKSLGMFIVEETFNLYTLTQYAQLQSAKAPP